MGEGSEQTFFLKLANDQYVHENTRKVNNHKDHANQNWSEISPDICQVNYYLKTKVSNPWPGCEEKETLVYYWGKYKSMQLLGKTTRIFLLKIENRITIWSSNPIYGYIS